MKVIRIIAIALVWNTVSADIDFTQIKGLYSSFRTKKYLSPIQGFAWWKSGQVRELYRYGNENNALIALIRELFYLNPIDDYTFAPTILPSKIGFYITPAAIGIILSALDSCTTMPLSSDDEAGLKAKLADRLSKELKMEEILVQSAQEREKVAKEFEPQILAEQKELATLHVSAQKIDEEKSKQEKMVSDLKQNLNELRAHRNSLKRKKDLASLEQLKVKEEEIKNADDRFSQAQAALKGLQNQAKELKSSIKSRQKAIGLFEHRIKSSALSHNALHDLIELIIAAWKETWPKDEQLYPVYTLHNILLSFLWAKADDKSDFLLYFKHLNNDVLKDNSILSDNSPAQLQWLKERYAPTVYKDMVSLWNGMISLDETTLSSFFINNYEQLIVALYSYDLYTSSYPPQVLTGMANYQGNIFPDCVETALRNVLNNIMFDYATSSLNNSFFEDNFVLSGNLKNFLNQKSSFEEIQSLGVRNAWAAVVSDLNINSIPSEKRIVYKTPPASPVCEVAAPAGMRNVSNLLQQLFNVDIDTFLEKIQKKFSFSVEKKLSGENDNFGYIMFANNNRRFSWHFTPRHAYVDIVAHYETTSDEIQKGIRKVITLLSNDATPQTQLRNDLIFNVLMLYRDKISLYDFLVTQIEMKNFNEAYVTALVSVLLDSYQQDNKIDFIKQVLQNPLTRTNKRLFGMVEQIIKNIIGWVDYGWEGIYTNTISMLLESYALGDKEYPFKDKMNEIVQNGLEIIKKKYPQNLPQLIDAILKSQRSSFYGQIKDQKLSEEQCMIIVSKMINPLYPNVKNYLNTITMPLGESARALIAEIYKNNSADFDAILNKKLDEKTRTELQPAKE